MNLGKAIKIALASKGMKQKELAESLGVSHRYISKICNQSDVGMESMKKIASVLDMKVSELVALGEGE